MGIFNQYSREDEVKIAQTICMMIGHKYDGIYEREIGSNKGVMFNCKDSNGRKMVAAYNIYDNSFVGNTFRWTKPWQGFAKPASVIRDGANYLVQTNSNATVMAWATPDMFDIEEKNMGGIISRTAKRFYVTDIKARRTWLYDVIKQTKTEL